MLQSIRKIIPPDWMSDPECVAVMRALCTGHDETESEAEAEAEAEEYVALFVGGCVRNTLLAMDVEDIDIATIFTPDEVTQKLKAAGIKVIPTGLDHGTLTAVTGCRGFEITTLRKDVDTDGRRAVVAFSKDWLEDAMRRDFTMNTLLADVQGNIYDPTGQGIDDLENGHVRFVGDAKARIAEDTLRILRFFRFHALYGAGEPDNDSLNVCAAAADKIPTLSHERITQEFFKILGAKNPVQILSHMFANGILCEFDFGSHSQEMCSHLCSFQRNYKLAQISARLFALAGLSYDNIIKMEELLLIPKLFKKDIKAIYHILEMNDLSHDHAVKAAIYKYGRVASAQSLMIELAQDRVMNGYARKALEIIQGWEIPNFPLSGTDLIEQGYTPGPELGNKLNEMEEFWIEQGFKPDRNLLINML